MSMVLDELGMEALEQQLHNATESPAYPPHRFVQKLVVLHQISWLFFECGDLSACKDWFKAKELKQ